MRSEPTPLPRLSHAQRVTAQVLTATANEPDSLDEAEGRVVVTRQRGQLRRVRRSGLTMYEVRVGGSTRRPMAWIASHCLRVGWNLGGAVAAIRGLGLHVDHQERPAVRVG